MRQEGREITQMKKNRNLKEGEAVACGVRGQKAVGCGSNLKLTSLILNDHYGR